MNLPISFAQAASIDVGHNRRSWRFEFLFIGVRIARSRRKLCLSMVRTLCTMAHFNILFDFCAAVYVFALCIVDYLPEHVIDKKKNEGIWLAWMVRSYVD